MAKTTLNISVSSIYRIFFIILVLIFLYYVADILLLIFTSFIIVSAISPLVDKLETKKIPRPVSTIFIYLSVLFGIGYLLTLLVPPIISQGQSLLENLPRYWNEIASNLWVKRFFNIGIDAELSGDKILEMFGGDFSFSQGFFSKASSLMVHLVYFAVIFSLSFYMTIQKNALKRGISMLVPKKNKEYTIYLVSRIQEKMGHWLQGQLFLNVIIGVLTYLALSLLGVPYALILALTAGFLEFIPNIGPIIATIFTTIVALTVSPFIAILVIVIFIVIQQLENHFIVPLVMKKAVGLNPVVIIAVILAGFKLGGPLGALLAVPITTAFSVFLKDFLNKENKKFNPL
jgi:predicted PurR-regulated permease PerM